jgi:ubiquinone biosynthesis UbiH/UbiF/VisC/COQ6 family hydroxylase
MKSLKHLLKRNSKFYSKSCYDVVVLGGGLVGATMMKNLKLSNFTKDLNVVLVDPIKFEKKERDVSSPPKDLRMIAVSKFSQKLFEKINTWERIEPYAKSYSEMIVWDEMSKSLINFKENNQDLGHIVENSVITNALYDDSFEILNQQVKTIERKENCLNLKFKSGEEISTKLLIGCDGANSFVRDFFTFPTIGWNYSQRALVSTVKTTNQNSIAYQKFLESGPLAMLPFGEYSNIVWSTNPEQCDFLQKLSSEEFLSELNNTLQENSNFIYPPIATEELNNFRVSFPLKRLHATEYCKERVVLVGDAAHVAHPLAGQGANLGFVDVVVLTKIIQESVETGQDIGSLTMLKKYEKEQFFRNESALNMLEFLKSSYQMNFGPIPALRNLGVSMVNQIPMLKNFAISQATGQDLINKYF